MTNKPGFWIAQMCLLLALYGAALVLALLGHGLEHVVVRLSVIVLAVHLLEVPVAFFVLKGRNPQALRVIVATILFGLLWWLPAKRGVLPVTG